MDLLSAVQRDRQMMLKAVTEARDRGIRLAEAEAAYQRAKHTRALEMRDERVAATLIQILVKGDPDVNGKLFERDVAKVEYDSAQEAINAYKLSARLIEAQIQREWNMAGGQL